MFEIGVSAVADKEIDVSSTAQEQLEVNVSPMLALRDTLSLGLILDAKELEDRTI